MRIELTENGKMLVDQYGFIPMGGLFSPKLKQLGVNFVEKIVDLFQSHSSEILINQKIVDFFGMQVKSWFNIFQNGVSRPQLRTFFSLTTRLLIICESQLDFKTINDLRNFQEEVIDIVWEQLQEYRKEGFSSISDHSKKEQFTALVFVLYAYNRLGLKGSGPDNQFTLNDLSARFSNNFRGMITQQFWYGRETRQIGRIIIDLKTQIGKNPNLIEFVLDKCENYYKVMDKISRDKVIGDLCHPILESLFYKELHTNTKVSWEVKNDKGKVMDLISGISQNSEELDMNKLIELISKNCEIYGIENPMEILKKIKDIAIDFTLTYNPEFLTQENIKNLGKVYKHYQAENRLLFIVNFRKEINSGKATLINELIHQNIKTDSKIDYKEHIIFISIDDLMDVLKISDIRQNVDQLVDYAKAALREKIYLDKLERWFLDEFNYLKQTHLDLGIGWELLSNYYNRPFPI
jgi:hypothetical protein